MDSPTVADFANHNASEAITGNRRLEEMVNALRNRVITLEHQVDALQLGKRYNP